MLLIFQVLPDSVMFCQSVLLPVDYLLWPGLLQVTFHWKISSISGSYYLQSRTWRWTQSSCLSELSFKVHISLVWAQLLVSWKNLSSVALDVPSTILQEYSISAFLCAQVPQEEQNLGRNTAAEGGLPMTALNKFAALVYLKICLYCYLALSSLSLASCFPHLLHVVINMGQNYSTSWMLLQDLAS